MYKLSSVQTVQGDFQHVHLRQFTLKASMTSYQIIEDCSKKKKIHP